MILAPAIMTAEPDPKKAGAKCLESVQLDPESYRIGHTRVNAISSSILVMIPECHQNYPKIHHSSLDFETRAPQPPPNSPCITPIFYF